MTLDVYLREIIDKSDIPRSELIKKLGISPTAFYKCLSGNISLELLLDILRLSGVEVSTSAPDPDVSLLLKLYLEQRLEQEKDSKGMRPYTGAVFILDYLKAAEKINGDQDAKTQAITE